MRLPPSIVTWADRDVVCRRHSTPDRHVSRPGRLTVPGRDIQGGGYIKLHALTVRAAGGLNAGSTSNVGYRGGARIPFPASEDEVHYKGQWFCRCACPFALLTRKPFFGLQVYHPNISSASGAICLDILTSKAWTPVLTLRSTLVSLRSLLCSPEPDDPQDAEVAAHYKADKAGFEDTARFWTECYAKGEGLESDDAVTSAGQGTAIAKDPILRAGLSKEEVDKFTSMVRRVAWRAICCSACLTDDKNMCRDLSRIK